MSLIGRKYIPTDNSYAVCLSDNVANTFDEGRQPKEYLLHGCPNNNNVDTVCKIVTEPFVTSIKTLLGIQNLMFVLVTDPNNKIHFVLFEHHGLQYEEVDEIEQDIKDNH